MYLVSQMFCHGQCQSAPLSACIVQPGMLDGVGPMQLVGYPSAYSGIFGMKLHGEIIELAVYHFVPVVHVARQEMDKLRSEDH